MLATQLPDGFRHIHHNQTGSTNSDCLEAARAGDKGNLWITSDMQKTGRGTRGRDWVSEPGNLYASLLLCDPGPAETLFTLSFVAALAVSDAILACEGVEGCDISVKWPNDVLVNGGKTCGILLESHILEDRNFVIIGQGINIAHFPDGTMHKATSLGRAGIEIAPDQLFAHLAKAYKIRLAQWQNGKGFAGIRKDWLARASGFGLPISVEIPGNKTRFEGKMLDLGEDGRLIVEDLAGRQQMLASADIFFAAPSCQC